jgi:hypothetical protein
MTPPWWAGCTPTASPSSWGIVDDPDEAESMAALGVDLLCTDDPVGLELTRAGSTSADAAVVTG